MTMSYRCEGLVRIQDLLAIIPIGFANSMLFGRGLRGFFVCGANSADFDTERLPCRAVRLQSVVRADDPDAQFPRHD